MTATSPLFASHPPGAGSYNDTLHARAAEELEAAVARIETEPGTEAVFAVGEPGHILAAASEQLDLLLVGSGGYGPLHAVMVGGVAGASCAKPPAP